MWSWRQLRLFEPRICCSLDQNVVGKARLLRVVDPRHLSPPSQCQAQVQRHQLLAPAPSLQQTQSGNADIRVG